MQRRKTCSEEKGSTQSKETELSTSSIEVAAEIHAQIPENGLQLNLEENQLNKDIKRVISVLSDARY